ncbi:TPA: multidrug transporter, partial [Streptococcus pyogenes]
VQDIKPLLNQYLEETGQAIVGWSDVTSGPSILDH